MDMIDKEALKTKKQYEETLEPYQVEIDDHSDDCGTVYKLKGPNVGILSKDEEELKARAEDFNLGFEMGRREGQHARMTEVEALAERLFEPIHDGNSVADFMGMAFEYGFWTGTTAPDKSKYPFLVEKRKRFWDILKAKGWKCGNVFAGREEICQ